MSKITNDAWLNPVCHRMLYGCTMASWGLYMRLFCWLSRKSPC